MQTAQHQEADFLTILHAVLQIPGHSLVERKQSSINYKIMHLKIETVRICH